MSASMSHGVLGRPSLFWPLSSDIPFGEHYKESMHLEGSANLEAKEQMATPEFLGLMEGDDCPYGTFQRA